MIFNNFPELIAWTTHNHNGWRVGVTSGCFDMYHVMHTNYLIACKRECDVLIVLIDSDKRISTIPGKRGSVVNEMDRAFVLDNTKMVDGVMIMHDLSQLQQILTHLALRGIDTTLFRNSMTIYNTKCIEVEGVKISIIPDVPRFSSTTEIINHLKQ